MTNVYILQKIEKEELSLFVVFEKRDIYKDHEWLSVILSWIYRRQRSFCGDVSSDVSMRVYSGDGWFIESIFLLLTIQVQHNDYKRVFSIVVLTVL